MRAFFSYWFRCVKVSLRGTAAFANDWQWFVGVPAASALGFYIAGIRGSDLTTGNPILDGVIAAFCAFFGTWIVAFLIRFINAPVKMDQAHFNQVGQLLEERGMLLAALQSEKPDIALSISDIVGFGVGDTIPENDTPVIATITAINRGKMPSVAIDWKMALIHGGQRTVGRTFVITSDLFLSIGEEANGRRLQYQVKDAIQRKMATPLAVGGDARRLSFWYIYEP